MFQANAESNLKISHKQNKTGSKFSKHILSSNQWRIPFFWFKPMITRKAGILRINADARAGPFLWSSPILGKGYEANFFHSVIFQMFQNHQNTCCILNITFIFDRCHHDWAAAAPVKYECDSKNLICIFARTKLSLTEKLTTSCWRGAVTLYSLRSKIERQNISIFLSPLQQLLVKHRIRHGQSAAEYRQTWWAWGQPGGSTLAHKPGHQQYHNHGD